MAETFKITLNKYDGSGEFGYIIYNIYNQKSINVSSLYITDENEQGKGYGYGLLILFLCYVIKTRNNAYFIKKINLDDCSDLALTKCSIYYKFGFRILNDLNSEVMQINFLQPELTKHMKDKYHIYQDETQPSIAYYKTIMDFYSNNILSSEKYRNIINNMSRDIINNRIYVSTYKYNNTSFELQHQNLDVSKCLNIDEEKKQNIHYTRSKDN
jgi:hypothetical protein